MMDSEHFLRRAHEMRLAKFRVRLLDLALLAYLPKEGMKSAKRE